MEESGRKERSWWSGVEEKRVKVLLEWSWIGCEGEVVKGEKINNEKG